MENNVETLLCAAEAPPQLLQGKAPRDRNSLLSRHQEITSTGEMCRSLTANEATWSLKCSRETLCSKTRPKTQSGSSENTAL